MYVYAGGRRGWTEAKNSEERELGTLASSVDGHENCTATFFRRLLLPAPSTSRADRDVPGLCRDLAGTEVSFKYSFRVAALPSPL